MTLNDHGLRGPTGPGILETVLTKFKEQGMRGLIIDLRGNTGGLMSSAMEVADAFLKEGIIVSTEGRIERSDAEYRADEDLLCPMDMPLAILVNGSSASGSEIVAGAMKDHERGIIVGEKTFGKALVQQRFPLDDHKRETGPAMSITISIYKTPKGDWIHGKGIEPNVGVEQPDLFEGEDDEVIVKLYEGEYIDKLVYDYVDKHKDQTTEEQIRALEEKIPELMKTLSDDEIELSERIIRWYVRSTFARVKYIPNVDLENDPQLAAAIEEIKKQLLDQGSS